MDEYNILRKKKHSKSGFTTNALLVSLSVIIFAVAATALLIGKTGVKTTVNENNNNSVENVSNSKSDCDCKNVSCLRKEQIFNENLRIIKDAAVSYFTNERLPKKVGDKVNLTLKKMQSDKLVLSIIDSNGKECDGESTYVEVTKEKNEYVMKIYLSCSDMKDYIIVHLGCYDYCNGTVCEKQDEKGVTEFEYEYKKTIACTMSDWSKWGEWQTNRETISNDKKEDTKVETTKKTSIESIDATKNPITYTCPTDYNLDGTKCVKKYQEKESINATKNIDTYTCPTGYSLNGTKCERTVTKTDTKDAAKNTDTYTCPTGYSLNGTRCEKTIIRLDKEDATKNPDTYTCPTGYSLNGTKCEKTVTKIDKKDATKNPDTYICPNGYSLNGTKCISSYLEKEIINATPVYKTKNDQYTCYEQQCTTKTVFDCSSGSCEMVDQDTCETVKKTCTKQVKYISSYTCPSGYLSDGSNCYRNVTRTNTINATVIVGDYVCPANYTLSGTVCSKTYYEIESISATVIVGDYVCPVNYTLSGTKCTRTYREKQSINATKVIGDYVCPANYTLSGTKCTRTYDEIESISATKVIGDYVCPANYKLNGTKCERTVTKTDIKDATKNPTTYTCSKDYKLNGTKCERTVTKDVKVTYYRYATRSCTGGSTEIKWSKNNNDETLLANGFKLTGNKREVK